MTSQLLSQLESIVGAGGVLDAGLAGAGAAVVFSSASSPANLKETGFSSRGALTLGIGGEDTGSIFGGRGGEGIGGGLAGLGAEADGLMPGGKCGEGTTGGVLGFGFVCSSERLSGIIFLRYDVANKCFQLLPYTLVWRDPTMYDENLKNQNLKN